MRTLKITLAYDGTGFVGWQRQAAGASIQGALEQALERLDGRPVSVVGAGRTDAGVHALGQVASCRIARADSDEILGRALNALVPCDIRVSQVLTVRDDFDARYSAIEKTYAYQIVREGDALPFDRRFAWTVPERLDPDAMRAALEVLRGTHDFAAFQASGSRPGSSVRTLRRVVLDTHPAPLWVGAPPRPGAEHIRIELTGDGFLRHMVRNIVGTLVEVGRGLRNPDELTVILGSRSRARAGMTAPPRGLFLVRVGYPEEAALEETL